MSPVALAKVALGNAVSAGWVHEVIHTTAQGKTLSMVNDIGHSDGRQVVDANGAEATVIVIGSAAYIQGDADAVENYFGLSNVDPEQVAGKWLSVSAADPNYSAVTASVTLRSDFSTFIAGPFTKGPVTTVDGQQAIPLFGHTSAQAGGPSLPTTLYVSTGAKVLPITFRASYQGMTETATWSAWGRAVQLAVPSHAIPESSVIGQSTGTSDV
jgi:hypothetical protein